MMIETGLILLRIGPMAGLCEGGNEPPGSLKATLYGAETWTLRRSKEKRLEPFEMWIWRRMERVKWTDRIRNEAVLERVDEERMVLKLISKDKGLCTVCECEITICRKYYVERHCNSRKHKDNIARTLKVMIPSTSKSVSNAKSEFAKDLCAIMIKANILFEDLKKKYTKQRIPNQTTLRKDYISDCYENTLGYIRRSINGNKIWVSIDETTDVTGRFVANVIVGILSRDNPGKTFLLTAEVLDKVNHNSIVVFFHNAVCLLWPLEVKSKTYYC
ncbi:hypothetical protein ANN_16761 [Periplaneta americana]|uniref:Uncharacterized protein n=1 Tax=Periplaneta americana TaxID=6978 RepID=A0ABQ8SR07_PERAM|nr:hypothetical protein ANN_16761 [Periplaneta americana]